jgi:hypothetical protein
LFFLVVIGIFLLFVRLGSWGKGNVADGNGRLADSSYMQSALDFHVRSHETTWCTKDTPNTSCINDSPQEVSPLCSTGPPVSEDGGVLGDGLVTDGLGKGFVVVRNSPGDFVGVGIIMLGAIEAAAESGRGSDLNTLSNRARWKKDSPVKTL